MTKEIEEIRQILLDKYDPEKADDLFDLYNLLNKYGMGIIMEIYPDKLLQRNIKSLEEIGLLKNIYEDLPEVITKGIHKSTTLNLDWVRYFIIYASIGNTTDAARYLNISSQALIQAISGIEAYLKVELVERKKHFKGLTLTGKLFYSKAIKLLNDAYDIDKYFEDLRSQSLTGKINIGWSNLWGEHILPSSVAKFVGKYQSVEPTIFLMDNDEIEKWLVSGEIDIGLMSSPPVREEFDFISGNKIPMVLVCKSDKSAQDLPFIIPTSLNSNENSETDYKDLLDKIYPDSKVLLKVDSIQLCLNLCLQGVGMAILPEISIRNGVKEGVLTIIKEIDSSKTLFIVWNKKIHLNRITSMFIKELRDDLMAYVPII